MKIFVVESEAWACPIVVAAIDDSQAIRKAVEYHPVGVNDEIVVTEAKNLLNVS